MKQAKEDVICAVEVWGPLLEETFGPRLEYAYAKGSALKKWDSPIDYVPVISDLDIHILLNDSHDLFPRTSQGLISSISVSKKYEERFIETRESKLHIPRIQIVHLNPSLDDPTFILPQVSDVHVMVGSPTDGRIPKSEEIRENDLKNIRELANYLEDIPRQVFDRVGLDFWVLLRRMSWKVSPMPIRLLTQNHSNPLEVWTWNRTRILQELKRNNYDQIFDAYRQYYDTGWKLFLSAFSGYNEFREIVVSGYNVLQGCLNEVTMLNSNR